MIDTSETGNDWDIRMSINAMLSRYMSIPFPELLDDETWMMKYRQLQWLLENNHLPVKLKKDANQKNSD